MRREGRKGKYGGEMVPLLCQGMPLTETEGYCLMPMNSLGLKDDGATMWMSKVASRQWSEIL